MIKFVNMSAALKCKQGKYFIRKSVNGSVSIKDYPSSCAWTNEYRVISVIEVTDMKVNDLTLRYFKKYGIDNVRGGSWQHKILSDKQIGEIKRLTASLQKINPEIKKSETKLIPIPEQPNIRSLGSTDYWACDICDKKFDSFDKAEEHEETCSVEPASPKGIMDYLSDILSYSLHSTSYVASFMKN